MKRMTKRTTAAFTLVELMITVAIIGILSATAMTLFTSQQLRSKRSEGMTNVEAIAKLMRGYFGDSGIYPAVGGAWPAPPLSPQPVPWDAAATAQFGSIGFRAEGSVRYRYDVDAGAECPCAGGACFTAFGYSNLDGDAGLGGVAYFQRDGAGVECPSTITGWFAPLDIYGVVQYETAAAYPGSGGIPGAPDDF